METSLARNLMSDEEWAFFERFSFLVSSPSGRELTNHRLVLDGVFWIARTGASWRDLSEEFGKWSSVYRQFRRWTLAGLWEQILEALNQSGAVPDAFQKFATKLYESPISSCAFKSIRSSSTRQGPFQPLFIVQLRGIDCQFEKYVRKSFAVISTERRQNSVLSCLEVLRGLVL